MLLVTDKGIRQAGLADAVTQRLEAAQIDYAIFDGVHGNPVEEDVFDGAEVFQKEGCDFVVGMGGGSPLDVAKLICLKATHPLPLAEYEVLNGGLDKISSTLPSMLAIPTAAGTGSEVGRGAVVTIKSLDRKALVFSPHLLPKVAIVDPELTVGLPKTMTAATGMDALTHNLESYLSTVYHPICDGIALAGVKLVAQNLRRACRKWQRPRSAWCDDDGGDDGCHCVSERIGRQPFTRASPFDRCRPPSRTGKRDPPSIHNGVQQGCCKGSTKRHRCGIWREYPRIITGGSRTSRNRSGHAAMQRYWDPVTRLREVNVKAEMIPHLAEQAMADQCHLTNPRPCTKGDMINLYQQAL